VAIEGALAAGGKAVSGRLSFKLAPLPGVEVKKLAVDTAGRMQGEVRVEHAALQGAAVTLKGEDGAGAPATAEVGLNYMAGPLNLSASVDLTSPGGPALWDAGTVAYEQFFVGGEVKYATGNKEQPLADYNACAGYVAGDFTAALQTKNKASQVQLSVHQQYSKDVEWRPSTSTAASCSPSARSTSSTRARRSRARWTRAASSRVTRSRSSLPASSSYRRSRSTPPTSRATRSVSA
jgi:hypothetical protein